MPASTERMSVEQILDAKELLNVLTAVKRGDFTSRLTVEANGIAGRIADTLNDIIELNEEMTRELQRIRKVVGQQGKIRERASLPMASGSWNTCIESVNDLITDLGHPITEVERVIGAVAKGDLSQTMELEIDGRPIKGEFLRTGKIVNTMVDQLGLFASEVTRVAREVGTEGKLGGQAVVKGVSGVWKDLTDNVNGMASNLTAQVRNIAEVSTAIATGDLSKKIAVDVKGEMLELKNTINTMVDQLNSFASEVTRVAREVGTEGKLGGQADVPGVAGIWKELTDNVNGMANNLTVQLRDVSKVATAIANGDLGQKITVDVRGEILQIKDVINTMVDQLNSFASEVTRVAREVGTEGKLGGQAVVKGVSGVWKDLTDNVNGMASNLTAQVRNIAEVTTAVATGDLSKKIAVDVKGEMLELKNTINTMVDQLNSFASEVTRVAREVGTEGKLGGQAVVKGVSGTWKDLTDNVNFMANNLTTQVRGIARVVTAVAKGDLKRKLAVEAKGEVAELAATINDMIDTLATFADQVTTVAREVGIEGKLGGQAQVPGASGTWRDLTDNVNRLAANLTTQVRAITEVTTAVAGGDLSKRITVDAAGELGDLKNNVNEMIRSLKETTRRNTEQDWLKTNLTKFTQILQGQKELVPVSKLILSELAPLVNAHHGAFYITEMQDSEPELRLLASYAYRERKGLANRFRMGEGLIGQCALEKERILITDVPADYIHISSGLGSAPPYNIVVIPVIFEGQVKAVIELASFSPFSNIHLTFLDQLTESIGIVLNTIEANMRTAALLKQSQSLAAELQSQQNELTETNKRLEQQARSLQASEELLKRQREELQGTNLELQEKAKLLELQKAEVERKNREIELARRALEEKAEQLALTSKYKSEFLANMSHELRTPLNSMLILSKMLAENRDANLTPKQVEFAETIHSSGSDLLALINEILDLSKIESGTMTVDIDEVPLTTVQTEIDRIFRQVANKKGLLYEVKVDPGTPTHIRTDGKRLQQVLKNLLSNAFKFTEQGSVTLSIYPAPARIEYENQLLHRAGRVIAFSVTDTGIGIPRDKQKVIFEAFQQADGTVSRSYGGTGLGLSISREIARLLGGEIHLESAPGKGSTFTLYLPAKYIPTSIAAPDNGTDSETDALQQAEYGSSEVSVLEAGDGGLNVKEQKSRADSSGAGPESGARSDQVASSSGNGRKSNAPVPLAQHPAASEAQALKQVDKDGVKVVPASGQNGNGKDGAATATDEATEPIPATVVQTSSEKIVDDRDQLSPGDRVLLIVEDDRAFARVLVDMAKTKGFKVVVAGSGEEGLTCARQYRPDAITLDIQLPGMHGLTLLDQLKHDPETRHIPVHILSVADELPRNKRKGAISQIRKPVSEASVEESLSQIRSFVERPIKNLLIVEDDNAQRAGIVELVGGSDIRVTSVATGAEALIALRDELYDCAVLDLGLPDMSGFELIEKIRSELKLSNLPIVVYTARDLTQKEVNELNRLAEAVIVKDVSSFDQLLDETALFLHRVEKNLPEDKRKRLESRHVPETSLAGKKVLIVDDDIRNIFAITSLLERNKMQVVYAENGRDGIEILNSTNDIDAVLMDVMMPGMDGYETTRAIRKMARFKHLPIIAVTAKAMKGDREKCIEAGASDYITKPVNVEQLLSLLRVWVDK